MRNEHEPYSEFRAERLFEETEEEKLAEAYAAYIKKDPKNAPTVIAKRNISYLKDVEKNTLERIEEAERRAKEDRRRAEIAINKKKALEKKYRKEKNRIIAIGVWLGAVIILLLFFEYAFPAWKIVTGLTVVGTVCIEIGKILFDSFCNREEAGKKEEPDGPLEEVWAFFHQTRIKRVMQLTAYILTICVTAGWLANLEVCEKAAMFCRGGYAALADSGSADGGESQMADSLPEESGTAITAEAKRYLTDSDERLIQQLDKTQVSRKDRSIVLNLSEEDYNILFFLEGSGSDSLMQEKLNQMVLDKVKTLAEMERDNEFDRKSEDGGPDQSIRNEISLMSESEKTETDFSKIKDILIFREGVNEDYPKRTLTQLVSNGYHRLALLLFWYGGEEATIVYYYGKSILFGLKCLEFADNTGLTVKEKLLFIAQRYEDIAYTCPGFQDARRARMLSEAFRYAADQY